MSTFTVAILAGIAAWVSCLALAATLCWAAAREENREREREDREVAELERAWELHVPARVLIDRHTR